MQLRLILLAIIFFIVRLNLSGKFYYHPDELMHVIIACGGSFMEVARRSLVELHPPLFYYVAYWPFKVLDSVEGKRLVSLIPSFLTLIALYRIGFGVRGRVLGITLALLFCFSPISVTLSSLLRHYALELFFLSFALSSLLCAWKSENIRKLPLTYILLMLLACMTNFSSFIPAFVIAVVVGCFYLVKTEWKLLLTWVGAHFSFIALAGVFYSSYFAEGRIGRGWNEFLKVEGGISTFVIEDLGELVFRLFNLIFHFFAPSFYLLPIVLCLLCVGGYRMIREDIAVFRVVFAVIFTHLVLAYFSVYPLAGLRYCYFIWPFWGLLLAYGITVCVEFLISKMPASEILQKPLQGIIFLSAIYLSSTGFYFNKNQEYSMPLKSYDEGMSFLKDKVNKDDILITNRLSHLYFLWNRDKGATMYEASDFSSLPFNGLNIYFANKNFAWEYSKKKYFSEFLSALKLQLGDVHPKKVWFFIFSHTDFVISSLSSCSEMDNKIIDRIKFDGFMAFSIEGSFFEESFLKEDVILDTCLAHSREPVVARAMFMEGE